MALRLLAGRQILGMDSRDGHFQIFQRQLELVRIAFRSTAEGRLLERGDPLFQLGDPLILTLIMQGRGDKHRLEGGNVVGKFGGLQHGHNLPDRVQPVPQKRALSILPQSLHRFWSSRFNGRNPPPIEPRERRLELLGLTPSAHPFPF